MTTYATLAELQAFLRDSDGTDAALEQMALDAATEAIDLACGTLVAVFDPTTLAITGEADTDLVTSTVAHRLSTGDLVQFPTLTGGAGLSTGTDYYVYSVPSDLTFKVGSAYGVLVDITSDISAGTLLRPIPSRVKLATLLQASRWCKRRDAPFGIAGSPEMGSEMRLLSKLDPDVAILLDGHGERTRWGTVG